MLLKCKNSLYNDIKVCVCYLPPHNSTRQIDANYFFENLLVQVAKYQDDKSTTFLCGDFNSRCADSHDFIPGIDHLPDRNVVDFVSNQYGDLLIEFLINVNFSILNGRGELCKNDFTFIGPQVASVVDYCLVPYESMDKFGHFEVLKVSEVVDRASLFDQLGKNVLPDHSLLR